MVMIQSELLQYIADIQAYSKANLYNTTDGWKGISFDLADDSVFLTKSSTEYVAYLLNFVDQNAYRIVNMAASYDNELADNVVTNLITKIYLIKK